MCTKCARARARVVCGACTGAHGLVLCGGVGHSRPLVGGCVVASYGTSAVLHAALLSCVFLNRVFVFTLRRCDENTREWIQSGAVKERWVRTSGGNWPADEMEHGRWCGVMRQHGAVTVVEHNTDTLCVVIGGVQCGCVKRVTRMCL